MHSRRLKFPCAVFYTFLVAYCFLQLTAFHSIHANIGVRFHKVQKGDSLYAVSRRYNITIEELYSANPAKKANPSLLTGEILRIPNPSSASGNLPKNPGIGLPSQKIREAFRFPLEKKVAIRVPYSDLSHLPHKGILFQKSGVIQDVLASRGGIVACIDYMEGYGNYIIIRHPEEYYSVYGNLGKILVNEGQTVPMGHKIGSILANESLYFQITHRDKSIDPKPLIL